MTAAQNTTLAPVVFDFENQNVRMLNLDGEIWFVAADVCAVLDIRNTTQALERLDEDERSMFNIGRQGQTNFINESGLYSLILGSRKPEAKRFKKWVTAEVLPAIRKTGSYVSETLKAEIASLKAERVQFERRLKALESGKARKRVEDEAERVRAKVAALLSRRRPFILNVDELILEVLHTKYPTAQQRGWVEEGMLRVGYQTLKPGFN